MSVVGRINPLVMFFLLSFAGALAQNRSAFADYYKYTDNKGTICITNDLKTIPRKYRATMKVVREGTPARKYVDSQSQTPPGRVAAVQDQSSSVRETLTTQPVRPQSRLDQLVTRFPWLTPLISIGSVIATFLFIIKLRVIVSSPQLVRLISLVLFIGVFIFVFKIYADHLVASYVSIKTKIQGIFVGTSARDVPAVKSSGPVGGLAK